MILVDTSVWIHHFRRGNNKLAALLLEGRALCHPFVVGELACGNLRNRSEILGHLARLPEAPLAQHGEVLSLVEESQLMGAGIGWIDAHLIASALLAGVPLWTLDRHLNRVAGGLGLSSAHR